MSSLSTLLSSLQKGFLKNVLTGAGVTLTTAGITLTALNTAIDQFKNSLGDMATTLVQFAGLAGVDVAFSLILGAITARYVQNSSKLFLSKATR